VSSHYRSYRKHLQERFGKPVLKVVINAGFSCPNRDGTISGAGCSFCDNRSFSPVADAVSPFLTQMNDAVLKASSRYSAFIAYLQPFSNTYGTVKTLSSVYEPLFSFPRVVGIAIGTRPDCFTEEIYDYLADVSLRTYLSVEIGLQSAHNETLALHNRGHTVEDFRRCIRSLSQRGIETVAHVMLGLPPETPEMMLETAREIADLPVTGVKIHQLMIIRGTALHQQYERGEIECLTLEKYTEILCDFLSLLRPDQFVHRIVADSSGANGLVAPFWSAEKMKAVNYITAFMDKKKTNQGSAWEKKSKV
jgi:radical SAM protein, TIGR01212 family